MNLKEENDILIINEKSVITPVVLAFIGFLLLAQLIWSPFASSTLFDRACESLAVCFFIIASVLNFKVSKIKFDTKRKSLEWQSRRGFWKKSGNVSFLEIEDVIIESEKSGDGAFCFRLGVVARNRKQPIPLTNNYTAGFAYHRQMQNRLLTMLAENEVTKAKTSYNY
jgi:hypothetical protein